MKNRPLVTIVTVTYNDKDNLLKTIKNVLEQTYQNIEYIVIDGNSTDGSQEAVQAYGNQINTFISEQDKGIYDAMNKAVKLAKGEWINFMNAGDLFHDKDSVSTFIHQLLPDTDLYCGNINYIDEGKGTSEFRAAMGIETIFEIIPCCHQALFSKTTLMQAFPFNLKYQIAADYDFLLKCYSKGHTFQFEDQIICDFLGGGLHKKQFIKTRIESIDVLTNYVPDIEMVLKSRYFTSLQEQNKTCTNLEFSRTFNKFYEFIEKETKSNDKIILYGYGTICKTILPSIKDKVIAIIDQNAHHYTENYNVPIIDISSLHSYDFQTIIITVLGREKGIEESLMSIGIKDEQIKYLKEPT